MASCMPQCVGELKWPVSVEAPNRVSDGCGGFTNDGWAPLFVIYCKITTPSGVERHEHQKIEAVALSTFVTRYRSDISEEYRLVFEGVPYNIRFVGDVETRRRWLTIKAERGVLD